MSWPMPTHRAQPAQAFYCNRGSEPIKLSIGLGGPGTPWTCFDADPGSVVQGPLGYSEKFAAAGFVMISSEEAEALANSKVAVSEPVVKAEETAEAKPEEPKVDASVIEQPQKAPDRKGRRADRSPTG